MHLFQNQKVVNQKLPNLDGVQITIKREDLLHTNISGNKFRKLKYNLEHAIRVGYNTLLTFGVAFQSPSRNCCCWKYSGIQNHMRS